MRNFSKPLPLTRRELLRGTALAAGSMLVGCGQRGCSRSAPLEKRTADVVVIGAGLSGLVTARELLKAGAGSVVVLEARNRVGGLTISQEAAPGVFVDGGGSWVRPNHTRILALAEELGVSAVDVSEGRGSPIFLFDGVRIAGAGRLFSRAEMRELRGLRDKLEAMGAELPDGAPWNAPRAAEYDSISMFNWLSENSTTVWGRRDVEMAIDWTFGCGPEEISLLRFVAAVKAQGGLENLMAISREIPKVFVGGSQQLSLKMAELLGDRVLLGSPVTRIVDEPSGPLRVETERLSIECHRVVVAMMPADARRIDFEPSLPKPKKELIRQWSGSPDYKVHIVYEKPFWRANGLNGIGVGDGSVVDFIFDNTPSSGAPGILVAFGAGEELPASLRARREAVVEALLDFFGDEAREAINVVDMDWLSEPWSSGCASPLRPGVLSKYGAALRDPVGRIHWAGSDTSLEHDGSMEGAVRSGERAAAEVATALRERGVIPAPATSSG
ncbi:FAD-dependent oxidoreductase [Polyangium jinanense]|uniref:flavin monoamine oxidase family protein n=1 Tax=Polyangium jinanense TaxID=2829994 RepID=UPI0023410CCC|nr:FAD-dependent oxidoreductase [Polyangium jinanense]MDC3955561.1 FAD-dependent oxidoreductase [Polyangium jinanense]